MNSWKQTFFLITVVVITSLTGCVSKEHEPHSKAITVMTYNVENLFDTMDDPGKEDETYLPIEMKKSARHRAKCAGLARAWWRQQCLEEDWSESKIKRKLKRLADVILQVKKGQGPDILILQEVENFNILERLRQNHLAQHGFKHAILIEGPDKRGIDVAMLSKLELDGSPQLHPVDLSDDSSASDKKKKVRPTRGILQSTFQLPGGEKLYVLGVHFPSQGSPTEARLKALATLTKVRSQLPKEAYVIAGGDFNITAKEDGQKALFKTIEDQWVVSHQVGCEDCQGTHSYRGSWSFLDVLLFSKNFLSEKWVVDKKSIRIPNKSLYQKNHFGGPARFNGGMSQVGVSDHWPLAVDIVPGVVR